MAKEHPLAAYLSGFSARAWNLGTAVLTVAGFFADGGPVPGPSWAWWLFAIISAVVGGFVAFKREHDRANALGDDRMLHWRDTEFPKYRINAREMCKFADNAWRMKHQDYPEAEDWGFLSGSDLHELVRYLLLVEEGLGNLDRVHEIRIAMSGFFCGLAQDREHSSSVRGFADDTVKPGHLPVLELINAMDTLAAQESSGPVPRARIRPYHSMLEDWRRMDAGR